MIAIYATASDAIKVFIDDLVLDAAQRDLLLSAIGEQMVQTTQDRINEETSPEGIPWVRSERAIRESGTTLRDDGHLFNSLNYQVFGDIVEWKTGKIAEEYADAHQFGLIGLPTRPYLGFTDSDELDVMTLIETLYEAA